LQEVFEIIGQARPGEELEAIKASSRRARRSLRNTKAAKRLTRTARERQPSSITNVSLRHPEKPGRPARLRAAVALLDQTLQEEKKTDALLSKLAQAKVNLKAA